MVSYPSSSLTLIASACLLLTPVQVSCFTPAFLSRTRHSRTSAFLSTSNDVFQEEGQENDPSAFSVGVLGDLHLDPRKMDDYYVGRDHFRTVLEEESERTSNVALVSLGDLGESKYCDHNPSKPTELFSGTTQCHELAADFLKSCGAGLKVDVPYEVIGGNHDLEGIDEFATDEENLQQFMKSHGKKTPQFCREIAEKTLLVGMGSTIFRDAPFTSHEVIIDDAQIEWFETLLEEHPADDGWKVFVFTHAPPNGSGLRVLQENHVVNGCCWLNHSDEMKCRKFIELVREHRCIKAWFSGHFHLGQDYQDSITFPTIDPLEGPYPSRGSCTFVQTSVMRDGTSRDGRQQSRLLRGNKDGFEICTIDHQNGGAVRLDATITYHDNSHGVGVYAHEDPETMNHDDYFKVYTPQPGDDGYINKRELKEEQNVLGGEPVDEDEIAWWRLKSGRVLGIANGMLLEYDKSTLAPLGLVVSKDELVGKHIAVIELENSEDYAQVEEGSGQQAVIMYDEDEENVTVIQPNEDGSYWRKIVRNKIARMEERRREQAAIQFAQEQLNLKPKEAKEKVVSSYGPYPSTVGVAKTTEVPGITSPIPEIPQEIPNFLKPMELIKNLGVTDDIIEIMTP